MEIKTTGRTGVYMVDGVEVDLSNEYFEGAVLGTGGGPLPGGLLVKVVEGPAEKCRKAEQAYSAEHSRNEYVEPKMYRLQAVRQRDHAGWARKRRGLLKEIAGLRRAVKKRDARIAELEAAEKERESQTFVELGKASELREGDLYFGIEVLDDGLTVCPLNKGQFLKQIEFDRKSSNPCFPAVSLHCGGDGWPSTHVRMR